MSSKRALVVDDSKSARAFLSRILERHEITVDAAESAEAAIDYLDAQQARRDLHGSHDAGHGRLPGRAVHQEQSAHLDHSHPHVHLAGRGSVSRPGARARRRRRAAQADQAVRRHQDALTSCGWSSDRRGGEQSTFTRMAQAPRSACPPTNRPSSCSRAAAWTSRRAGADAVAAARPADSRSCCRRCRSRSAPRSTRRCRRKSPRCAASSARTLDSHAERLQGDLAALLPATRTPELDLPTLMPERRAWGAISGWSLALLAAGRRRLHVAGCGGSRAARSPRCAPISTAAYAELETLRARPR